MPIATMIRRTCFAIALLLAAPCVAAGQEVEAPRSDTTVAAVQPDSAGPFACPAPGYCDNVVRQVHRFFRAPEDSRGASGEVCFRIQRDGSVRDISTQRVRNGGAPFRLALMEAVEDAGSRRAFGALPETFDPAKWLWCVEISRAEPLS